MDNNPGQVADVTDSLITNPDIIDAINNNDDFGDAVENGLARRLLGRFRVGHRLSFPAAPLAPVK